MTTRRELCVSLRRLGVPGVSLCGESGLSGLGGAGEGEGDRVGVEAAPTVLVEAMPAYAPYFRGFEPVPAARAALAYARSVEGAETGKVYRVY